MNRLRVSLCAAVLALLSGPVLAQPSLAELQPYVMLDGRVVIDFLESNLEGIGLEIVDLQQTADTFDPEFELMEGNLVGFQVAQGTNLMVLRNPETDDFQPYGVLGGQVSIEGGFSISSPSTEARVDFHGAIIRPLIARNDGPGGEPDPDYFHMAPKDGDTVDDLQLCYVKILFGEEDGYPNGDPGQDHETDPKLLIKAWDLVISETLANKLGRPEIAGKIIGQGKIAGDYNPWEGHWELPEGQNVFTPYVGDGTPGDDGFAGGIRDVKLGILSGINDLGHVGTFPNGRTGMSMATTSCNVGDINVPWLAAMQEDHPGITMQLYRVLDGRFEMVGISWVKHGFFALSNSQCTPCQNPSGGSFLGVGCSDTYGNVNNGDRQWLGPRDEWDAFAATWECLGSYFDGTPVDCDRDESGNGLNSVDHRLESFDYDLGNPGATYYYEANYLVRDDDEKFNNIGSRRCTMSWNGSSWSFNTPGAGNPLLEGPALLRWGDMKTVIGPKPDDGDIVLAVEVTDLGGGQWRYEYALFNWDLEAEVDSFTIPVRGSTSDYYFHDIDDLATNDWVVTTDGNNVTFTFPEVFESGHKVGGPLGLNYLYNFGFTANRAPAAKPRNAVLGLRKDAIAGKLLAAPITAPSGLGLTFSDLSPDVGQIVTMQIVGGTDGNDAMVALLEIGGVALPSAIVIGPVPFAGGEVVIPLGSMPPELSGIDLTWVAADVASQVIQLSNVATLATR